MNFNAWMRDIIRRIERNSNLRLSTTGSVAYAVIKSWSEAASEVAVDLDSKVINAAITTATGEYLEAWGKVLGVDRATSAYGYGQIKISLHPDYGYDVDDLRNIIAEKTGTLPDYITIPAGTEITNLSGDTVYHTASDIILSDTDNYGTVVSYTAGSAGKVAAGALNKISGLPIALTYITPYLVISNPLTIDTGVDEETDENYRYRLINAYPAQAGSNDIALRLAALSVSGVSNVYLKRYVQGIGTVGLFIVSQSPIISTGLINAVQEVVDSVKAGGDHVIVSAPDYRAMQLSVVLEFKPDTTVSLKDSITALVRTNIVNYINNLKLGEEFVLHRMENLIYEASDQIYDYTVQRMGSGEYNFSTGLIDYYMDIVPANQPVEVTEKWVTSSLLCEVCY